jgi:hypothetical protein
MRSNINPILLKLRQVIKGITLRSVACFDQAHQYIRDLCAYLGTME